MHTKKTNNTNKLIQISYHSILTKIQNLQNLKNKNKNKNFFLYRPVRPVPAGIARNWPVWPVFFPVQNKGVERIGLLAGTVYSGRTDQYGTKLTTLIFIQLHYYVRFFLLEILFLMLVLGYLRPFHRKIVN